MKQILSWSFAPVQSSEFNFFIRSTGYFRLTQIDNNSCHHNAKFGEIFWCISGTGCFIFNNRKYRLNPGYVWYYPPGSDHYFYPLGKHFEYCWMTVNGKGSKEIFDGLKIPAGSHYAGECPQELFAKLLNNIESAGRNNRLTAMAIGFQILTLAASIHRKKLKKENCAEIAKKIIDEEFSDKELSVERIAELLHVNRVSLSRSFFRNFGINISSYLQAKRIQLAQKYLRETNLPINEIAWACGFCSTSYFSRIISQTIGVSPKTLRASYTNLINES